jgi:hypothetical protein
MKLRTMKYIKWFCSLEIVDWIVPICSPYVQSLNDIRTGTLFFVSCWFHRRNIAQVQCCNSGILLKSKINLEQVPALDATQAPSKREQGYPWILRADIHWRQLRHKRSCRKWSMVRSTAQNNESFSRETLRSRNYCTASSCLSCKNRCYGNYIDSTYLASSWAISGLSFHASSMLITITPGTAEGPVLWKWTLCWNMTGVQSDLHNSSIR